MDLIEWIKSHLRLTIEILLIGALFISGWLYNKKSGELNKIKEESSGLANNLRQQIILKNNQLEILTRENGKVTYRNVYVPPEGYVVIKKEDQEALVKRYQELLKNLQTAGEEEKTAIKKELERLTKLINNPDQLVVKDKGFTFKPGMGVDWANHGTKLRLDFKWAYFKRYSALFGGSENGIGLGVSRHLDDVLWFHPNNLELLGAYNFFNFTSSAKTVVVGLRTNF